ncbi:hypothetical protein [Variovorax sp. UC122_21]|uniref:hypothetical protein n=1 Tax=Variovorax sp. UC122_21 TaxID=3374554 RepID=UPI003757EBB2
MRNNTYSALGIALLATLTACGGGGGGGGGGGFPIAPIAITPSTPPPAANPDPVPQDPVLPALSLDFELLTNEFDPVKLLAALNAEGGKGFRWVTSPNFKNDPRHVLSKDTKATDKYIYEFLDVGLSQADYLTQINARGAHGFRLLNDGTLLRNSAVSAWYSYALETSLRRNSFNTDPNNDPVSLDGFLAQLNAKGAQGSRYIGEKLFASLPDGRFNIQSVYENAGNGAFQYEMLPGAGKDADFIAQLNAQGAKGFRLNFIVFLKSGETKAFYVKDKAQTPKFTYWIVDRPVDASAFLAQLKDNASRGRAFFVDNYASGTDRVTGPGSSEPVQKVIYSASAQCQGVLCGDLYAFSIMSIY